MLHSCLFYRDCEERDTAAAAFLKAGLERGERCVMAAAPLDEAARGLRAHGLDVGRLERRGDLILLDAETVYLQSGRFSVEAPLQLWADHLEEALAEGRAGLCAVGDATCIAVRGEIGARVLGYEIGVNRLGDIPVAALCCYDRLRFGDAALRRILCAHPAAHIRRAARENPFFANADDLRGKDTPPRLSDMLSFLSR